MVGISKTVRKELSEAQRGYIWGPHVAVLPGGYIAKQTGFHRSVIRTTRAKTHLILELNRVD